MKNYYTYILSNYDNSVLYIGITNNLVRRTHEHKNNLIESFSSKYKVHKLVYFEETNDANSAISRERQLKAGSRQKKLDLIAKNNPEFNDLYPELL
ncbi:MAG: GIY-YIG nuclease family protein [Candidatus Berkelbacteria bacterium]